MGADGARVRPSDEPIGIWRHHRIVVNAYFEFAQSAGGFRSWWRMLMGSDETLDRAHMERLAG